MRIVALEREKPIEVAWTQQVGLRGLTCDPNSSVNQKKQGIEESEIEESKTLLEESELKWRLKTGRTLNVIVDTQRTQVVCQT